MEQTNRQTDRLTHTHTDRHTDTQTERQTSRPTLIFIDIDEFPNILCDKKDASINVKCKYLVERKFIPHNDRKLIFHVLNSNKTTYFDNIQCVLQTTMNKNLINK